LNHNGVAVLTTNRRRLESYTLVQWSPARLGDRTIIQSSASQSKFGRRMVWPINGHRLALANGLRMKISWRYPTSN